MPKPIRKARRVIYKIARTLKKVRLISLLTSIHFLGGIGEKNAANGICATLVGRGKLLVSNSKINSSLD